MKTLLAVIACAGVLSGCAVAPADTYPYSYGYAAPYAYGPYYDYGPYYYGPSYYGPGYYGYYSAPVIVGGFSYYSHGHRDWHGQGHDWHGARHTTTTAPNRTTTAAPNRSTRTVVAPAQRASRGNAPALSRAPANEVRPAS